MPGMNRRRKKKAGANSEDVSSISVGDNFDPDIPELLETLDVAEDEAGEADSGPRGNPMACSRKMRPSIKRAI